MTSPLARGARRLPDLASPCFQAGAWDLLSLLTRRPRGSSLQPLPHLRSSSGTGLSSFLGAPQPPILPAWETLWLPARTSWDHRGSPAHPGIGRAPRGL